ncbi:LLM class flavin-dependent oxidoreductase [Nocardioides sp. SR21]|uniref:LLM class flavin-dependent oxidoreductase n=1 Tax=Nocardioides sp. SR21 TaxID=2919501 RepID=UPI001FAA2CC8|nr:LLM class flavin-dependent oxidoreductase [Nocardioides sp. SR21]
MRYGAHLPLADLGSGLPGLTSYARTAAGLGFSTLAANDHLVFSRPWLDGIVALSSVVEASGDLRLATTAALPVVRGPAATAKAAAALATVSGGRFTLGVGPGSSAADYALAGLDFAERWPRFEAAVRDVRSYLDSLEPRPARPVPIWVASWGSAAGLRRVARLGDGWLASAYNTTPALVAAGRSALPPDLTCAVATMWTWVTDSDRERRDWLTRLSALLNRPEDELAAQLPVGPPEACAELLSAYAAAGVDELLLWPVADHEGQLERVMREVVPLVR